MAAPSQNVGSNTLPSGYMAAVTPHDSTNFSIPARALYVGGSGNIVVVGMDGAAVTFSNVSAGAILPVQCVRVNSTSTTATNIVALF